MHVQWVRVEKTIGGKGLSIPNLLLHAKGGVSDNHEGNFSRTNGHSELHHLVRMPLFLWNQTHPHYWHGKLSVIEMSLQQGGLNFWSSQFPHLWHNRSSMIPPFAVPPFSFILILSVFEAQPHDILYSLHFWPTVLDNGFQILQECVPELKMESKHESTTLCSYLTPM